MKKYGCIAAIAVSILLMTGCNGAVVEKKTEASNAQEAVSILKEGNERYLKGETKTPTTQQQRTKLTKDGQHPYAVVLSCSDSRVPVEEIFSCNAGEIFVVRTAGNVIGDLDLGSIEYGAEHCGAPLILVMGHSHCGAVTAAVEGEAEDNYIGKIVKQLEPVVAEAKKNASAEEEIIAEGVKINVQKNVQMLKEDKTIGDLIAEGKVEVYGAVYDIESGEVQWM